MLADILKNKLPHHFVVLFSSFAYILAAIFLFGKDEIVIAFLFLVFITSIFYHSYPRNIYFRVGDWIASLSFIFYISKFLRHYDQSYSLLGILAAVCLISWFISFVAFIKNHNFVYNISHTIWHLLSGLIIYLIVFNV